MITELKGWHVLVMMLAFFGVTIAVNVVFTMYAIGTFSGEDVSKPYLKGLEYNRTLEARAAQAALGWKATIEAEHRNGGATISTHIVDRDGQAKSALTVEAVLQRPTDARLDRTIDLSPAGDGNYRALAADLAPGVWDLIVRTKNGDVAFEARRRVVLK
jgi:nitrogen fixation protein FixH